MNKHGFKHVRKVNDGRPKPYLGRIAFSGVEYQTKGFATAREAHEAAIQLKQIEFNGAVGNSGDSGK